MSNDGCGYDGGKGGKGGGKGRLGVRRMSWKIERMRREKKEMLFNYLIHISKAAPALADVSIFELYTLYIFMCPSRIYYMYSGGRDRDQKKCHVRTPCNTESKSDSKQRDQNSGSGGRVKRSF